jgi:23S rRNA (adenine2503-C2)-methyltransferase
MRDSLQTELLGLDLHELTTLLGGFGQPAYRGRQVFEAVYRQRLDSIAEISTLPRQLREQLATGYSVGLPRIEKKFESVDGTIRYLMALCDGELVETVWMPEGDGGDAGDTEDAQEAKVSHKAGVSHERKVPQVRGAEGGANLGTHFDRATICVSSQVGCAVNCQFCMTALLGVTRSLSAGEIVGQILAVLNDREVRIEAERINLVFMGMGEPFLNYDNFMKAVRLLVDGAGIPESRMTVSTSGIVPRIHDFAKEPVRPKLAISLNASNNELRERIMPINRKWKLDALLTAAREFPLRPRERLTFEYVLLDRVNDGEANARELLELLRGLRAKVNLIALNAGPEIPYGTPSQERVLRFQEILVAGGLPAFIRRPRGRDIYAACGQLKKTVAIG